MLPSKRHSNFAGFSEAETHMRDLGLSEFPRDFIEFSSNRIFHAIERKKSNCRETRWLVTVRTGLGELDVVAAIARAFSLALLGEL